MIDDAAYREQRKDREQEIGRLTKALKEAGFENDPIGFLLSTPCVLAIINQEDLTGETDQQNLPGSTWQNPNWRRKMKIPVEELTPVAQQLKLLLHASGRGH